MATRSSAPPSRQACQTCGTSMRHEEEKTPGRAGHHRTVFYCPTCDARRLRG